MNRTFLLALTLVFAFACGPQPAPNSNGKGNSNSTANGNRGDDGIAAESGNKLVVITVGTKPPDGKYYLSVAPDIVTLSVSEGNQIEWVVSNPFPDVILSNIQIGKFTYVGGPNPNTDPFGNGGGFTFAFVAPASTAQQQSGRPGPGKDKYGIYDYMVTGTATIGTGAPIALTMDPRVVVGD
ncbi:MAG: hypothetical protein AABO41_19840 [Acidobacteriota bacterium]